MVFRTPHSSFRSVNYFYPLYLGFSSAKFLQFAQPPTMVSCSSIGLPLTALAQSRNVLQTFVCRDAIQMPIRKSGHDHHQFPIQPSRFQWNKFKDLLHYYAMLGLIPVTGVVLYVNLFIGSAQLSEIPEGYEPKHWSNCKYFDEVAEQLTIALLPLPMHIVTESQLLNSFEWLISLYDARKMCLTPVIQAYIMNQSTPIPYQGGSHVPDLRTTHQQHPGDAMSST